MTQRIAILLLVLGAAMAPAAASAQTVHKCTVDGKITYTEIPCQGGQASVIAVPTAPAPPESGPVDLKRLKKEADALEAARHRKEAAEDRADAATNRVLAKRHATCERLKLEKRWAEQDFRRATPAREEAARIKVQHAGDKLKLACGS
jgi:hypothetical protein